MPALPFPSYYEGLNTKLYERVPADAKRILDVGCAEGRLGAALKAQNPQREVWGIELLPHIAATARQAIEYVLVGDVEAMDPLPLPEAYFDSVLFGDVLEHLKDPWKLLRRIRPHLAEGATLACCVPNVGHWMVLAELLQGSFRYSDAGLLDRTHLRFFTPRTLREMLWDCGYLITDEEPCYLEDQRVAQTLACLSESLGLDPAQTVRNSSTYQQVYTFTPRRTDGEGILGPHVGRLGPSSLRCSVVAVTYNSGSSIEGCLRSVLATLGSADEVVVVDNASSDDTLARVDALNDERITAIRNGENLGYSKAANQGLLASRGEFLVLLNPDTAVWPGWIERLSSCFTDGVGAVGPSSDNVAGDQFAMHYLQGTPTSVEELSTFVSAMESALRETRMLLGFCIMLRREVLDHVGLLDEQMFLGADDLELSWRLRELGYTLQVCTNAFVHHAGGASFSTLAAGEKERMVSQSDAALVSKLRHYYGILPSSWDIWRSEIFTEALERSG